MSQNETATCKPCDEAGFCVRYGACMDAAVRRWLNDPEFKAAIHRYDRKKESNDVRS